MDVDFYRAYQNSRDLSWRILLDYQLIKFPLDVKKLIQLMDIKLVRFEKVPEDVKKLKINPKDNAAAASLNDSYYILFNPYTEIQKHRSSLGHELGHILLGHVDENHITVQKDEYKESQAKMFAARLLMPAIVCKIENLTTPGEISSFFGTSLESANYRADRMAILNKRGMFETSPIERAYADMYRRKK